jgi:hypothetical protein
MSNCVACDRRVEYTGDTYCDWCLAHNVLTGEDTKPKRRTGISVLQEKIAELEARVVELEGQKQEIITYLALPKFSEETWVSKYDILTRLGVF